MQGKDGFRSCWVRVTRRDDYDDDWSSYYVDYEVFKKRLMYFSNRRKRLRVAMRNSPDKHIDEDEFVLTVGPKAHLPIITKIPPGEESQQLHEMGKLYNLFLDKGESDSEAGNSYSSYPKSFERVHHRHVMPRVTQLERDELVIFLTTEMDKCAKFYHEQWQRLYEKEEHLLEIYELGNNLEEHRSVSQMLAHEILDLFAFCATNILTVRQVLIRYDAFVRTHDGTPMLQWYMKKMNKKENYSSFRAVLRHQELKAVADLFYEKAGQHDPDLRETFLAQANMFEDIFVSSRRKEMLACKGHEVLRDSFVHSMRDYFLLGTIADSLGLEPSYLTMRGTSLTDELEEIAKWQTTRVAMEEDDESTPHLTFMQLFSLFLNLLSAFFYLMNYYIVEPSSTNYANALGAQDAMSGLLIGMMPWAAFISSIAFSMWTNYSFRYPLLVSGLFLISGNVMYFSAYSYKSFGMALAGRFITGLGAPKVIVRRYMADTTPLAIRTSVNAAFGMVVAVGSALGPATAILLNKFDFKFNAPVIGTAYVNGMTGPGFLMAILWTVFTVIVLFTFSEPDRKGLDEQKKLEAQANAYKQSLSFISERGDDDINSIFSADTVPDDDDDTAATESYSCWSEVRRRIKLLTLPVKLCLAFLFAKVFVIESLVSCTSALTKNRYRWQVEEVGTLGCINGLLVVPLSVLVGWLSMSHQDRVLMTSLVSIGALGMFLLIDISDLIATPTNSYNKGNPFAVNPPRYVVGYFLTFCSIQSFEGVIGSALSKVIPTALASGTLNSGLLATLVDTLGRSCGDFFISFVGVINLRQLMNLLFIPAFTILIICLLTIRRYWDVLAV